MDEPAAADTGAASTSTSTSTPPCTVRVLVKHGAREHALELQQQQQQTTALAIKQRLERDAGVLVRHQKLIHKGKVLADGALVADGTKLMLLAAAAGNGGGGGGGGAAGSRGGGGAAAAAIAAAAARAGSNHPLAEKMAALAAARAAAGGGSNQGGLGSGGGGLAQRRANWTKIGVVALRDLGLEELPGEWLEGLSSSASGTSAASTSDAGGATAATAAAASSGAAVIKAVDASHNRLPRVPAALASLRGLASLSLHHNALEDGGVPWRALGEGLRGSLTALSLGHNRLTALPAELGLLLRLVNLDARANALQSVAPDALRGVAGALQVLLLADNAPLTQLPDSLADCGSLVALDASRCALASLPDGVTRLSGLVTLSVDGCRLAGLPPRLFVGCAALATLSAHGNPLTVEALRAAEGFEAYEARRRARASKQLSGRVMAELAMTEGADVEQWARYAGGGPAGLGRDGSGRAGQQPR